MSCDFRHIFNTRLSSKNITPRHTNKKLYMNDSPMNAAHRHAPAKTIKMMQGSSNGLTCFILIYRTQYDGRSITLRCNIFFSEALFPHFVSQVLIFDCT